MEASEKNKREHVLGIMDFCFILRRLEFKGRTLFLHQQLFFENDRSNENISKKPTGDALKIVCFDIYVSNFWKKKLEKVLIFQCSCKSLYLHGKRTPANVFVKDFDRRFTQTLGYFLGTPAVVVCQINITITLFSVTFLRITRSNVLKKSRL